MPKFRPAKKEKSARAPAQRAGLPCLVMVLVGMALVMLFLYFVMRGFAPTQ
jgi:hypothetical protein